MHPSQEPSHQTHKPPKEILNSLFAFSPNRDTLGGTAYFIVRNEGNILIDCPPWNQNNQDFLESNGGVRWFFISHRGAIGKSAEIQQIFGCEILIQEQEAYLLPKLRVTAISENLTIDSTSQVIWTPGHSPGSSCFYYNLSGGILFTGRHLVPNQQGEPAPLRTSKTFHWQRQIKSINSLLDTFTPQTLQYICPGANTGFLRGKGLIDNAYNRLANLDLAELQRKVKS
ncbi:MBL fold metallo-hydrolase [Plectonema cf. radiosum LEGE 06105]|uniref:MBL fold metallo-hydrolase n=1 Tax=Plectonema cf. radiosum LEGE 06105 TaxID=945769 RepID=A0A8J7K6I7_9CYAN|nr:MBL fold metallo-hydrolase [Plectonema radiosum]MBE9215667.1 MBL fold metallo-hydrolase [Plectonema cf. radiosum LEGE 06105]